MELTNQGFNETVKIELRNFLGLAMPNEPLEMESFDESLGAGEGDVYALFVSVLGDVEGILVVITTKDTIYNFINKLPYDTPADAESDDFLEMAKGYIGEFANILMGKIIKGLEISPEDVEFTTPSVIFGQSMQFSLPYSKYAVSKIKLTWGVFELMFYYNA